MGDRGSKKAYTRARSGMYLHTKFGCDQSIVVGCRSWNDGQTDKQTSWNDNKAHYTWRNKQKGMTIRLSPCEHDAIIINVNTHTHTHTTILWPSWVSLQQKGKTNLDLLEKEIVSGSGISWAICKSAPWPRYITTPASHHSVFYKPDALPATQPTASKHWRQ